MTRWLTRLGWMGWLLGGLLFVGMVLGYPRPVGAVTPTPEPVRQVTDDDVNAIAKKLYCPVCENIPLDTCGTQACEDWRQLIRQKLEEGWTEEQILEYFVERYGERVLATPRPKGPHILVYVLPPVFIVAGVFLLFRTLRSWRTAAPEDSPEAVLEREAAASLEETDPYRKRLEEELRKRL